VYAIKEEYQKSIIEIINGHNNSAENNDNQPQIAKSNNAVEALECLKEKALTCQLCPLKETRQQVVFGTGNYNTRLMMVGEGPGRDEDMQGEPFVGKAGQLLNKILLAAEINREDIYITNVVKCRPPNNRIPVQPEIEACMPYLQKQIDLINPIIIVCLGSLATKSLIDKKASITRFRGSWCKIEKRLYMATFHPAALLRDPGKKKYVWQDMKEVMKVYHKTGNGGAANGQ